MLLATIFKYFVLCSLRDLNSECRDMKRALSPLPSRLESLVNDKKYYSSWPISFLELYQNPSRALQLNHFNVIRDLGCFKGIVSLFDDSQPPNCKISTVTSIELLAQEIFLQLQLLRVARTANTCHDIQQGRLWTLASRILYSNGMFGELVGFCTNV